MVFQKSTNMSMVKHFAHKDNGVAKSIREWISIEVQILKWFIQSHYENQYFLKNIMQYDITVMIFAYQTKLNNSRIK